MHFGSPRFRRQHCSNLNQIREDPLGDSDHETSHPPLRFLPMQTCLNPPPYNEVASKPDMYPLVQGGHDFKNDSVAFVYANTHFIHSYMPYNSGTMYMSSPAESNSSLFHSTTASNYMYPPPYSDGNCAHPSVSTPGSIMSACTPTEPSILNNPFLSSTSPPMATTPTSQQILSEVTTPADSIASPTSFSPVGFRFCSANSNLLEDPRVSTQELDLLSNLVADIQNMTNRMMRSPALVDGSAVTGRSSGTNSVTSPVTPSEISSSGNDSSGQPPRKRPRPVPVEPFTTSGMSITSRDTSMDCGLSLSHSTSCYSHDLREVDSLESELEMDRWTSANISVHTQNDNLSLPSMSNGSGRSSSAAECTFLSQPLGHGLPIAIVASDDANISQHERCDVQTNVVP